MKRRLDIHIFSIKGTFLCYDVPTGRIVELSARQYEFLKDWQASPVQGEVPEEYRALVEGLSPYEKETAPPFSRQVTGLTLIVTQTCNMRCTYCYADDGSYGVAEEDATMSWETAEAALSLLFELAGDAPLVNVTFFGGEPLLNLDLIRRVVPLGRSQAAATGKTIIYTMVTNGTLLTAETCRFLLNERVRVVVSLDGDKELNDETKKYGDSHYDVVTTNLQPFQRALKPTIRTTVSKANFEHLQRILDCFTENGWPIAVFEEIGAGGDDSLCLSREDSARLDELYDEVFERLVRETGMRQPRLIYPFTQTLLKIAFPKKNYHGCSAGRRTIAVDTQGNIYACHRLVGDEAQVLGNVAKGFFLDVLAPFYGADITSKKPCSTCWARYLCSGGCVRAALVKNGDITKPDGLLCSHTKKMLERGIYHSTKLSTWRLLCVLPNLFRSLRNSPGYYLKQTDWQLLEKIERFWGRFSWFS